MYGYSKLGLSKKQLSQLLSTLKVTLEPLHTSVTLALLVTAAPVGFAILVIAFCISGSANFPSLIIAPVSSSTVNKLLINPKAALAARSPPICLPILMSSFKSSSSLSSFDLMPVKFERYSYVNPDVPFALLNPTVSS